MFQGYRQPLLALTVPSRSLAGVSFAPRRTHLGALHFHNGTFKQLVYGFTIVTTVFPSPECHMWSPKTAVKEKATEAVMVVDRQVARLIFNTLVPSRA